MNNTSTFATFVSKRYFKKIIWTLFVFFKSMFVAYYQFEGNCWIILYLHKIARVLILCKSWLARKCNCIRKMYTNLCLHYVHRTRQLTTCRIEFQVLNPFLKILFLFIPQYFSKQNVIELVAWLQLLKIFSCLFVIIKS